MNCQQELPCGIEVTSANTGVLTYIKGFDANRCEKWQDVASLLAGVPAPAQTPITKVDSPSIAFTVSGVNNHTITGSVRVSGIAGNTVTINPDGIYVPAATPFNLCTALAGLASGGTAQDGVTAVVGANCQTFILPAIPVKGIQVDGVTIAPNASGIVNITDLDVAGIADSSTVDLSLIGTTVSAIVKVSATAGNQITVNPDGLFVAAPAAFVETTFAGTGSNSISWTAGGTNGHSPTANVRISATAGNIATINADGIYVPTPAAFSETTFAAVNSSTIAWTAGGTNGHAPTAAAKISTTAGNQLSVDASGLFVPAPGAFNLCTGIQGLTAAVAIPAGASIPYYDAAGTVCGRGPLPAAATYDWKLSAEVPGGFSTTATVTNSQHVRFLNSGGIGFAHGSPGVSVDHEIEMFVNIAPGAVVTIPNALTIVPGVSAGYTALYMPSLTGAAGVLNTTVPVNLPQLLLGWDSVGNTITRPTVDAYQVTFGDPSGNGMLTEDGEFQYNPTTNSLFGGGGGAASRVASAGSSVLSWGDGTTTAGAGTANNALFGRTLAVSNASEGNIGSGYNIQIGSQGYASVSAVFGINNDLQSGGGNLVSGSTNTVAGSTNIVGGTNNIVGTNVLGLASFNVVGGTTHNVLSSYSLVTGLNQNISGGSYHVVGGANHTIGNTDGSNALSGNQHSINSNWSAIVTGMQNEILGPTTTTRSVIGGGFQNKILGGGGDAGILAGAVNKIDVNAYQSVILGGNSNVLEGVRSLIGVGAQNAIAATASSSAIVNGQQSTITGNTAHGFMGGAYLCTMTSSPYSAIASGRNVTMSSATATQGHNFVGSGADHILSTDGGYSSIVGGVGQKITGTGGYSFIGGGAANEIRAAGNFNAISGGQSNIIDAANWSFVGGGQANVINGFNGSYNAILGGVNNTINNSNRAVIIGSNITVAANDAIAIARHHKSPEAVPVPQ